MQLGFLHKRKSFPMKMITRAAIQHWCESSMHRAAIQVEKCLICWQLTVAGILDKTQ